MSCIDLTNVHIPSLIKNALTKNSFKEVSEREKERRRKSCRKKKFFLLHFCLCFQSFLFSPAQSSLTYIVLFFSFFLRLKNSRIEQARPCGLSKNKKKSEMKCRKEIFILKKKKNDIKS